MSLLSEEKTAVCDLCLGPAVLPASRSCSDTDKPPAQSQLEETTAKDNAACASTADSQPATADKDDKVLSLAEQFLAAMPDRIKFHQADTRPLDACTDRMKSYAVEDDVESMDCMECNSSGGLYCSSEDLGVESMADDFEFNLEEACHR